MTSKIFVGYRLRAIDAKQLAEITPEFEAGKNLKDKAKIAADIEARREAFLESAASQPYTCTFDEVFLCDPQKKDVKKYHSADRARGTSRDLICVSVAEWLAKYYTHAWDGDVTEVRKPEAIFVGFAPRLFLKVLGLECSLPEVKQPLPLRLWYTNTDHRDIEEAILPNTECKKVPLAAALKRRRPTAPEDIKKWDANLKGWTGPHVNPIADVTLAIELATQLGFFQC